MKNYTKFTVTTLLFAFFSANAAQAGENTNYFEADSTHYTANISAIKEKKEEMMAIPDSTYNFLFSDDTELQAKDPQAHWLMLRMMTMVPEIETADDGWAWMLAMNEYIDKYNVRNGHKTGTIDAATHAIEELIDIYNCGNQPQLNTASYVLSILAHYKTLYAYYSYIEQMNCDTELKALFYREYKEWFDMNNAVYDLMYFYTYACARYSSLPMDLNGKFGSWSEIRLSELEIEKNIICEHEWKPFHSNAKSISKEKFDNLLEYFRSRNSDNVIEEISDYFEDKEFAIEMSSDRFDFEKIAEMIDYYETALANWRDVREEITQKLPQKKQNSYREITKQVHTRLYNDMVELKKITF